MHLNRSFRGVEKRGDKGGGEEERSGGREGGKMSEKEWEKRGPKVHSKNSDFGSRMI